ncbi:MAG: threonine--tRNA ligase [bacterium]|nr:threonine--tRNA ligase [bacterium]
MIDIRFPDGSTREYPNGSTPKDVADSISRGLGKAAVAARFEGDLVDLDTDLVSGGSLEILTTDSEEGIDIFWHSTSHIMAQAIKRLWPEAKIAIGPTIDTGFYYDIDLDYSLSPEDLDKIETEMKKISKEDLAVHGKVVTRDEAIALFKDQNEDYKVEIIQELEPDDTVKIYSQGEFTDLCRGPHIPSTNKVKHFKLTSLAGAYWRGDEKNKMLQRVYGVSYPKEKQLTEYLDFLEEAKKRDHRRIGKQLDLFSFQPEGPGFVFWHNKGMVLFNEVVDYWRELHERDGYNEIRTPVILNEDLWHKSGHWDNYKENMYFTEIDNNGYAVKPMNCPGGVLVFKNSMWSYRDLPVKFGELGLIHRHEKSGVLHGLFRVRMFTMDDAHIYCLPEQVKEEVIKVVNLVLEIYNTFGFTEVDIELSTKPEKSIGSAEIWEHSEKVLAEALDELNIKYKINEGDGAFYGPKIDFHIKDVIGRSWQCGTVQVDFSMPERLGATYINKDGQKEVPVMIHRAILGSLERFIGILIEHYGGDFPLWLAPVQVVLIPVSEKHHEFTKKLYEELRADKFRVKIDDRNEKVGYKIRENELQKIPYMCVVGDKEVESGSLAVRRRIKGDLGIMSFNEFKNTIFEERRQKL